MADINQALLGHNIFGGKDLTSDFAELGQCALYCVTEVHGQAEMDKLVFALMSVLGE